MPQSPQVVVVGHICLDLIPALAAPWEQLQPGTLVEVGAAVASVGGVCNTAIALHKLGTPTRFVGRIGSDPFGAILRERLAGISPELASGVKSESDVTSYSVVINPADADRMFLHCPGANDNFSSADVSDADLAGAAWMHFGYPPVMKSIRARGGADLAALLHRAQSAGLKTSLDMCSVDPASDAGRTDWVAFFRNVLPRVNLFAPSVDEVRFMLGAGDKPLDQIADRLLELGAKMVALKLGEQGLYLKTREAASLGPAWSNRELATPCFQVKLCGGTGAGDCTIAGLLTAIAGGASPESALEAAVAVGACCVEAHDATGGIIPWSSVKDRISRGWARRAFEAAGKWRETASGVWAGPKDRA